jgi:hypothetical protein
MQCFDRGRNRLGYRYMKCWPMSAVGHSETFVKGQSVSALPHDSDINLFRYCEGVVDLDA